MGSAGLQFDAGDVLSSTRLNQKTVFVGTTAQITAATKQAGQHFYDTTLDKPRVQNAANSTTASLVTEDSSHSAGDILVHNGTKFVKKAMGIADAYLKVNSAGTDLEYSALEGANPDIEVYPHSSTIGDYTQPGSTDTQASSNNVTFADDFSTYGTQGEADTAWPTNDTSLARVNISGDTLAIIDDCDGAQNIIYHDLGSAMSDSAWCLRFSFKVISKTTNVTPPLVLVMLSNSTSGGTVAQDMIGMKAYAAASEAYGAMDTDGATYQVTGSGGMDNSQSITFGIGTTYYYEITRTSTTTYTVKRYSGADYSTVSETVNGTCAATTTGLRYIKIESGSNNNTGVFGIDIDNVVFANGVTSLASTQYAAVDNNTSTFWQSNNEANPWLRVQMSSSADKEPSALALWTHANTTATDIKIQTSPDGSTWTDRRRILVSALTHGAYNYIRFNRDIAQMRYLRVYAMDGGSVILAIAEVKVLMPTESQWNRRHGHKAISASSTSVALAG